MNDPETDLRHRYQGIPLDEIEDEDERSLVKSLRDLRAIADSKWNVYRYLDLSTSFLPEGEQKDVAAEGARDGRGRDAGDMPRVISHYYGWWVNVPDGESQGEEGEALRRQRWPALHACIEVARSRGCNWINFDGAASDSDPELRTYEDFDASSIEADPMQAQRRGQ